MDMTWFVLIFMAPLVALAILGCIALAVLKILTDKVPVRDSRTAREEVRIIQEIHQSLSGMEKRIESLEAILLEKEKEATHDKKA